MRKSPDNSDIYKDLPPTRTSDSTSTPLETVCPKCQTPRGYVETSKPGNFCSKCGHKYAMEVLLNESS